MGQEPAVKTDEGPKGLGGWLILVMIGLVVSPFMIGYQLFTTFLPVFQDDTWARLTTPGSEHYHALWGPLIVFEIIGNTAVLGLGLVTLYLLVRCSRHAPRFAIIWLAGNAGVTLADYALGQLIPAVASANDPEAVKNLAQSVVGASIWVPYFLVSKRVRNTFVN